VVNQPLGGGDPITKPVRRRSLRWVALGVLVIVLVSSIAYFGFLSRVSPLTTRQVIALVQPSVVAVKVSLFRGGETDGSGFVYQKPGHILTNAHLLARAVKVSVVDAAGTSHYAYLIGVDRVHDVAELVAYDMVVGAAKAQPLKIASQPIAPGANVLVIGNRFGILTNTVMSGQVEAAGQQLRVGSTSYANLVETDTLANAGNSGGPMVNSAGDLVGIVTVGSSGHAYAIPVAGFAAEAQEWTRKDSGITLGPPLVSASAQSLVGGVGPGFPVEASAPWGSLGYTVSFRKKRTSVSDEQGVTIYVGVYGSEATATSEYQFYTAEPPNRGYAKLGMILDLGDDASVWATTGYNGWGANHLVLWRDRNVVVILYWDADYPEDVSIADVLRLAAQQESPISADLASYQ
jgi:S1-C subfamily serine protease